MSFYRNTLTFRYFLLSFSFSFSFTTAWYLFFFQPSFFLRAFFAMTEEFVEGSVHQNGVAVITSITPKVFPSFFFFHCSLVSNIFLKIFFNLPFLCVTIISIHFFLISHIFYFFWNCVALLMDSILLCFFPA